MTIKLEKNQIVELDGEKHVVTLDKARQVTFLKPFHESYQWGDVFEDSYGDRAFIAQFDFGVGNYFNLNSGNRYLGTHQGSKEEVVEHLLNRGFKKIGTLREMVRFQ
ncbi:hypothetical protein [Bacillus cereus]|uniref:hypothetical protein n=1 Tax=Bacillus cereus TaxID=1396 RepID=UPI0011A0AED7|nr:hypothetical protein [Bacillus cereus]